MIKVDMEMPKSCEKCRFCLNMISISRCLVRTDVHIIHDDSKKPYWCPLIECEDEKQCDTCNNLKVRKKYRMCDEYECDEYSKWQAK